MADADSYSGGSWTERTEKKGKDGKGEYEIHINHYKVPCGCHPETCSHFDGKTWTSYEYKVYLDEKE